MNLELVYLPLIPIRELIKVDVVESIYWIAAFINCIDKIVTTVTDFSTSETFHQTNVSHITLGDTNIQRASKLSKDP